MSMWNREKETLSRDEYSKLQLEGLKKSLARVWGNEFYRSRLEKGGVGSPDDVKSLDDLAKLPLFTKEDFREAYPLKMSCVDRKELLEFHMSSGSTGTRNSMGARRARRNYQPARPGFRPAAAEPS